MRHTPTGGGVGVHVAVDETAAEGVAGNGVRFVVVDSGPGFPADSLATAFDRFTRSADSGGSGLGLSNRPRPRRHPRRYDLGRQSESADSEPGGAVIGFTVPVTRTDS